MRFLLTCVLTVVVLVAPALAEPRHALVIGNGAYGPLGDLPNPVADAELISETLERLDFDVIKLTDSDRAEMARGIKEFGRRLKAAGPEAVGLFYFAGHGVQVQGFNFLVPVGARVGGEDDLERETLEAYSVLAEMRAAGNRTNIIILDACRNNPFTRASGIPLGRGLAQMDAPIGSFIAYATGPGDVAFDGDGTNSPYSAALARAIPEADEPIEQIFKRVRVEVLRETEGLQTPWDTSSLTEEFYFNPETPGIAAVNSRERALWNRVTKTGDPDHLETYLAVYPDGAFAGEARTLLGEPEPQPEPVRPAIVAAGPTVMPLPGADTVTVEISLAWSRGGGWLCRAPGDVGRVELAMGAAPVSARLSGGDARAEFRISARSEGPGAALTLEPVGRSSGSRIIDVGLPALTPGSKGVTHSTVRLPDWAKCGGLRVFATVAG
ncbi:MAG: caspase family protein [Pseudomonadota bacterium]